MLLDDVAFGDTSVMGGSAQTPVLEKLALDPQDWGLFVTQRTTGHLGRLFINGKPFGAARFRNFGSLGWDTLDIGSDTGTPVSDAYSVPFAFTGQIEKVTLELQ